MAIVTPRQAKDLLSQASDLKTLIDLLNKEKNVKGLFEELDQAEATIAQSKELTEKANNADKIIAEYNEKNSDATAVLSHLKNETENLKQAQRKHEEDKDSLRVSKNETENLKKNYESKLSELNSAKIAHNDIVKIVEIEKSNLIAKNNELDNLIKEYNEKLEVLKKIK